MPPTCRVLMLTHRLPFPPDRGDRIRAYHLLRQLARTFEVDLACVSDEPVTPQQRDALTSLTGRWTVQCQSRWRGLWRGGLALASGGAATPGVFDHPGLSATLARWHREKPYDALLTFCTGMSQHARRLMHGPVSPPRRHVLDLCDVDSLKWARYARSTRGPMRWVYSREADRLGQVESGNGLKVDAVTLISEDERAAYRRMGGHHANVHVVGNGVDLDYFHPQRASQALATPGGPVRLVFVGVLNYQPNVEAVRWFADQVMPLLRDQNVVFTVVGKHPAPGVVALNAREDVEVVGPVADVRPWLWQSSAVVAPLRLARGVQNKVLEAMACGKAVVCSPEAARGIDAQDGQHLHVAQTPRAYADALTQLIREPAQACAIGQAARKQMQKRYAWSASASPMVDLLQGRDTRKTRCVAA